MKSLSILILLGTVTALLAGGLFAVSPVLAENHPQSQPKQVSSPAEPVAPITGDLAVIEPALDAPVVEIAMDEPGTVLSSTFTVGVTKDWAAQEALQEDEAAKAESSAKLNTFIASVSNGNNNQVTGIYVDGILANAVVGQPSSDPGYVSGDANVVTQFEMATQYGSQAFLAHNFLAGGSFFQLTIGQIITLVYGDGSTADFQIQSILRYQALSPTSTQSRFVDLENGNELSASELFYTVYNNDNPVILQTCIENEGESSWGRLFVQATPVLDTTASVLP